MFKNLLSLSAHPAPTSLHIQSWTGILEQLLDSSAPYGIAHIKCQEI